MADNQDNPANSRPSGEPLVPRRTDPALPVTGRSATVAEIGRELGELDFEPDDLLASLDPKPVDSVQAEPGDPRSLESAVASVREHAPEATLAATALGSPRFERTEPETPLRRSNPNVASEPQPDSTRPRAVSFAPVVSTRKPLVVALPETQFKIPSVTAEAPAMDGSFGVFPADAPDVVASEELAVLEELIELPPERLGRLSFPHERPCASHLDQLGLTKTFNQIAELLAQESAAQRHPQEHAEFAVVSSELYAMTGQRDLAQAALAETPQASIPLVSTQQRQLAFDPGDLTAYAQLIRSELRNAATHESRRHLMTLYVDVARRVGVDEAEQRRHLELSLRAFPTDARLQLQRLAGNLAESPPSAATRSRAVPVADALGSPETLRDLQLLRQRAPLTADSKQPVTLGLVLRRAIQDGKKDEATAALLSLRQLEDYRFAAAWLLVALLRHEPGKFEFCDSLLQELAENGDEDARLALLEHSLEVPGAKPNAIEVFAQEMATKLDKAEKLGLALAARADKETITLLLSELHDTSSIADELLPLVHSLRHGLLEAPISEGADRAHAIEWALGRSLARVGASESAPPTEIESQGLSLNALLALSQHESIGASPTLCQALRLWHATRGDSLTSTATSVAALSEQWPEREQPFASVLSALLLELDGNRGQALSELNHCLSQFGVFEVVYRAFAAQSADGSERACLAQIVQSLPPSARRTMLQLEQRFLEPLRGSSPAIAEAAALPVTTLDELFATTDRNLWPLIVLLHRSLEGLERLPASTNTPDEKTFVDAWAHYQKQQAEPGVDSSRQTPTAFDFPPFTDGAPISEADERSTFDTLLQAAQSFGRVPSPAAMDWDCVATRWQSSVASAVARLLVEIRGGDHERFEAALSQLGSDDTSTAALRSLAAQAWLDPEREPAVGSHDVSRLIAERAPNDLGALRTQLLFATTRGTLPELGGLASRIAVQLDRPERYAHAWLASMSYLAGAASSPETERALDCATSLVGELPPHECWALRRLWSEARRVRDDARLVDLLLELLPSASSALDAATLALRAAEATARLGRWDDAERLLDEAVSRVPDHLVALSMRAEFLEARGDHLKAAEAFEALAQASGMPSHKVAAWLHAAELYEAEATSTAPSDATIRCLEAVLKLDLSQREAIDKLRNIYLGSERFEALEQLLTQQLLVADDTEQRLELEIERARVLLRLGRDQEAQIGLERAISLSPEHEEALQLSSQLLERAGDFDEAEQQLLKLASIAKNVDISLGAYRRLAHLYDTILEQPGRAEVAYREVLRQSPADPVGDHLVALLLRTDNPTGAVELLHSLLEATKDLRLERDRSLELSRIYDELLGERRRAEEILEKTRRRFTNDGAVLRSLAAFHRRGKDPSAFTTLLDRSLADARRALNAGRFEAGFFDVIATVGELRDQNDLTLVARASLAALTGEDFEVSGIGLAAANAEFADLLAPDVLSLPLRALLRRTGWALCAASPVDLRALRAVGLAEQHPQLVQRLDEHARAFGLGDVTWYLSPALGTVCQPLGSHPPTLAVGPGFCALSERKHQDALTIRALRIVAANAPALANTAPVELWPLLVAYLSLYLPNWMPAGVNASRVQELRQSMQQVLPPEPERDLPALAADVAGSIGNRASQLGLAVQQWGSRTALLALGDPKGVLVGIAAASAQLDRFTERPEERLKWVVRNPEARDLLVYSVNSDYLEARAKQR